MAVVPPSSTQQVWDRVLQSFTTGDFAADEFGGPDNTGGVIYDNTPLLPNAVSGEYSWDPVTAGIWARFTIKPAGSSLADIGGLTKRIRIRGVAICQIFGEVGKGAGYVLDKASVVEDRYTLLTFEKVTFQIPSVHNVGKTPDGKWWQVNVVCPFYADRFG